MSVLVIEGGNVPTLELSKDRFMRLCLTCCCDVWAPRAPPRERVAMRRWRVLRTVALPARSTPSLVIVRWHPC